MTIPFDYDLPEHLIALFPQEPREQARLLRVDRKTGEREHGRFDELPRFLASGDLLILNNTRVIPARLYGVNSQGRRFEILLLKRRPGSSEIWDCLVRPGKRIMTGGTRIDFPGGVRAHVEREGASDFTAAFYLPAGSEFLDWLKTTGEWPLPPYLKRKAETSDGTNYQTVYAKEDGSVAAPTAGLHFSRGLLDQLLGKGVEKAEVTLHIGYGTFAPLRPEHWQRGELHSEFYEVPASTFQKMRQVRERGNRIFAVGTTALRAIESISEFGLRGETKLFIRPGFEFKWTDGLITNFHLPQSSLLVLVSAFLGSDRTLDCYREAVHRAYRFFSYGDAMLIV